MRDKNQANERIEWLVEHLGYGKAAYPEYKEKFGKSPAVYYQDRKEALALMKSTLQSEAETWKTDLIARLEKLYERNVENGRNQAVALDVLKTLAKLTGNMEDKVQVNTGNSFSIKWEKDEDNGRTGCLISL